MGVKIFQIVMRVLGQLQKELAKLLWRLTPRAPIALDSFRSGLSKGTLLSIQRASFQFEWNGVRMIKNPFDLALYQMLLSKLRPKTIIEIGSASGGSALWFGAQSRALNLRAKVWSFDISAVRDKDETDVMFRHGDIHSLSKTELPKILKNCERPLLVVEDGPHTFSGSLAALRFFDQFLEVGDYIVIEDGVLRDLGYKSLEDGPNRAVRAFLLERPNSYKVDREYCDFWGPNYTWNTNGYLERIK